MLFKQTQAFQHFIKKINATILAPQPTTNPNTGKGANANPTEKPIARIRKVVHLKTHTTQPMRTEADIDLYLAGQKAELMQP